MTRRPRHKRHSSHDRWLVSYADFITLLFAFFVVLYSVAQVDRKKVVELAEAIQQAFGTAEASSANRRPVILQIPPGELAKNLATPLPHENPADNRDLTDLRQELERALAEQIAQGQVSIRSSSEGLVISLQEAGFFDSGSASIRSASQSVFGRIAAMLSERGARCASKGTLTMSRSTIHYSVPTGNFPPPAPRKWSASSSPNTNLLRSCSRPRAMPSTTPSPITTPNRAERKTAGWMS